MTFLKTIAAALAAKLTGHVPMNMGLPQFAGQRYADPARRAWREQVRKLGRRQAIRARRYLRASQGA